MQPTNLPELVAIKRSEGRRNQAAIIRYFTTHPCCTSKDCARALGLRQSTVSTHAARIRQTWRGKPSEPTE